MEFCKIDKFLFHDYNSNPNSVKYLRDEIYPKYQEIGFFQNKNFLHVQTLLSSTFNHIGFKDFSQINYLTKSVLKNISSSFMIKLNNKICIFASHYSIVNDNVLDISHEFKSIFEIRRISKKINKSLKKLIFKGTSKRLRKFKASQIFDVSDCYKNVFCDCIFDHNIIKRAYSIKLNNYITADLFFIDDGSNYFYHDIGAYSNMSKIMQYIQYPMYNIIFYSFQLNNLIFINDIQNLWSSKNKIQNNVSTLKLLCLKEILSYINTISEIREYQ